MDRVFVLIIGPSGAGKDTLLKGAADFFRDDSRVKFIRRCITRQPGKDEDNCFLSEDDFTSYINEGKFLSHWQAHGHLYGIMNRDLIEGINIMSVSRTVIEPLCRRNSNVRIIEITAEKEIIRERLKSRGRETEEIIDERMNRYVNFNIDNILTVNNSGSREDGVSVLTDYISSFLPLLIS